MKLSPTQKLVLRRLVSGPATTRDLYTMLSTNQSNMHHSLQRMEQRGLVVNTGATHRAMWQATEAGKEALA